MDKIYEKLFGNLAQEYYEIIQLFNKNKLNYCLIKFPNKFPVKISDIDVLLDKNSFEKCRNLLIKQGFVQFRTQWFEKNYNGFKKYIPGKGFVNIDLYKAFLASKKAAGPLVRYTSKASYHQRYYPKTGGMGCHSGMPILTVDRNSVW